MIWTLLRRFSLPVPTSKSSNLGNFRICGFNWYEYRTVKVVLGLVILLWVMIWLVIMIDSQNFRARFLLFVLLLLEPSKLGITWGAHSLSEHSVWLWREWTRVFQSWANRFSDGIIPLMTCIYVFRLVQKQLAYMLGRQQIFLELDEEMPDYDELVEIMSNSHLNNNFLALAREVTFF